MTVEQTIETRERSGEGGLGPTEPQGPREPAPTKAARGSGKEEKTPRKRKAPALAAGSGDLVIVESPTKARTLARMLGARYTVEASSGHIRDLPKSKLG